MAIPIVADGHIDATDFIGDRVKTISPASFKDGSDTVELSITNYGSYIVSNSDTAIGTGFCGLDFLPDGAVIKSIKVYWFRDDAAATGEVDLVRVTKATSAESVLASADSDASTGNHTVETVLGTPETIDTTTYSYHLFLKLNPNDGNADVKFRSAEIKITIDNPRP